MRFPDIIGLSLPQVPPYCLFVIQTRYLLLYAGALAWACALLPTCAAPAADAPIADGKPYDNSRRALGTHLHWMGDNNSEKIYGFDGGNRSEGNPLDYLIADDETISPELPKGKSLFVLKTLADHNVASFSFYNHGAAGTYRVSALSSSRWKPIGKDKAFSRPGPQVVEFPEPVATRQVKVEFETTTPGQVSGFGLAAPLTEKDVEAVRLIHQPDIDTLNSVVVPGEISSIVGVAPAAAGAAADKPENMIDDLVETSYRFDPARSVPATLLDLGEARQIERVTALVETDQPLRMEVYLPEKPENVVPSAPATTTLLDSVLSRGPLLASTGATPGMATWLAALAAPITTLVYQSGEKPGGLEPILYGYVAPGESRVILPLGRTYNGRFVLILFRPTGANPGNFMVREINLLGRYIWRFYDDFGTTNEGNNPPPEFIQPPPTSR
jgi:hypothetical protein